MSTKLKDAVKTVLLKEGSVAGKARLSMAVGKSWETIRRWINNGVPTAHDAYQLALACGLGEEEAHALACECFPLEAKETA